jgi:hypothetical protein
MCRDGGERKINLRRLPGTLSGSKPERGEHSSGDDQEEVGVLRGIPKPPSSAASGCLEAGFCGAAGASSSSFFEEGDGS